MILGEPNPTPLDLNFEIFKIPVRVSGFFWVLPVIFGAQLGHPVFFLVTGLVIFTGVLVHELGHALTMRRFGISPRIVLTMMGGFATSDYQNVWNLASTSGRKNSTQQMIISAAGPIAGFALAGLVAFFLVALGGWVQFSLNAYYLPSWSIELSKGTPFVREFLNTTEFPTNRDLIHSMINYALFVNIYWGLMNLLPVYPLDGGQIAREAMVQADPREGLRNSLWLSVVVGAAIGFAALMILQAAFMAILFGIFAFQSWQTIQKMDGKGFGSGRPW
ncbi:site-2 protease family protein [Pirellulaceae bacterium]|jgi:stage IV sporulation protein FB|nr:site-2 protease family protein [Pirellulaceae bacterium]MDB4793855.1 site-2 protease family protein [Pirellulaceae bacterium]